MFLNAKHSVIEYILTLLDNSALMVFILDSNLEHVTHV